MSLWISRATSTSFSLIRLIFPIQILQFTRTSSLPIEVWERIIDWIVQPHDVSLEAYRERFERLSVCSLVCRAWRTRAQARLFEVVSLKYERLLSLDRVLRSNPAISSTIREMFLVKKPKAAPISFFTIRHQLSGLTYLNIGGLNLTGEHQWLYRSPLFRSVQRLKLFHLQTCQLSQLIRFVNCFHSLSRLDLSFAFEKLEYKGQILPMPSHANTRSVTWLELDLKPGVSRLIDWFLNAESLLSQLKTLILYAWMIVDEVTLRSSFEGVDRLLYSCRNSIEELSIRLERIRAVESVSDIAELG